MSKGTGLYGGSFDPPHFGHIHVLLTALEQGVVDRVWVVPTFRNPLRGRAPIADGAHRLAMVQRAFAPLAGVTDRVTVCDIELRELFACYTIDVVRRLRQITAEPFRLILGSDCLTTLAQWKECEELLQLAPPCLIARNWDKHKQLSLIHELPLPTPTKQSLIDGWIQAPCLEISSTIIRARLQEGLYCGHLVPQDVLDYITAHSLYQKKY